MVDVVYTAHMNPSLNGSSALERFERGNAIEIHNEIMFDFYWELPQHVLEFCFRCLFLTSSPLPIHFSLLISDTLTTTYA